MATYLQGVQDYIPQIQPAQPDFNFYNTVLQTKQNQYDTNYKKLNKLYGQLYYADLSRESNVEKREQLVKDIDFNLKRVAGLDLSLEQNMTQATQLFKPFYEDKVLVKDMAWTKNYMNQRSRAEGMKNATNKELREQYWDTGVRAMDYMREEFAATSDEESMGFRNASYTPYTNVMKIAGEIAKEFGDIEAAPDVGGQWIIKRRNGKVLEMPLRKLFEARLGNDPSIQAIYQTQAYVDRKDYAYGNAAQFGGDKEAAEMDYLQKNYQMLVNMNNKEKANLDESRRVDEAKKKDVEDRIKNGNARPQAESYLQNVLESLNVNTALYQKEESLSEDLGTGSATLTTSSGFRNPYGDIESLRRKVDAGMASALMRKDLHEAAYTYSMRNAKVDIVANPYGVLKAKHQNDLKAIKAKKEADIEVERTKYGLETGALIMDARTGDIKVNPDLEMVKTEHSEDASTPEINLYEAGKREMEGQFEGGVEEVDVTVKQYQILDPTTGKTKFVDEQTARANEHLLVTDAQGRPVVEERIVTEQVYTGAKPFLTETLRLGQQLIKDKKLTEQEFLGWFGLGDPYTKFRASGGVSGHIPPLIYEDERTALERLREDAGFGLANPLKNIIEKNIKAQLVDNKIYEGFANGSLDAIEDLVNNINAAGNNDPNFFKGVYDRVKLYTEANADLKVVDDAIPAIEKTGLAASDFGENYNNWQSWKKDFNKEVKRKLKDSGVETKIIDRLFTTDGDIVSEDAYEKLKEDMIIAEKGEAPVDDQKWRGGLLVGSSIASARLPESDALRPWIGRKIYGFSRSELSSAWKKLNSFATSNTTYENMHGAPGIPVAIGPGGGLTSTAGSITVSPRAYGTKGQVAFSKFSNYFMSEGLDHTNTVMSFNGAFKAGFDAAVEDDAALSKKGMMVMNDYISKVRDPNAKIDGIRMVGQKIAAGDATKGAFKFYFPREYLESFKPGKDEEGGLSSEEIDMLATNGLTYIGDNSSSIFRDNPLIKNHRDPIKNIVDYNKSYHYKDPRGTGGFKVEQDPTSATGYKVTAYFNEWDNDRNEYTTVEKTIFDQQFDNNLYLLREQQMQRLDLLDVHNIESKNGRI